MYGWEGKDFETIKALTQRRKPRRYPVWCVTEGVVDGETHRVTQRFKDVRELSQFLQRMEPQRWGLAGLELIEAKERLQEALTALDVFGFTNDAIAAHNATTEPLYRVVDWGKDTYSDS